MSAPVASLALVGLGNMGVPMARRWIEAGVSVQGFDPDPQAANRLADAGGTPCASAAEAASAASAIVLMLPNSVIVDAVIDELLAQDALQTGDLVIDMSSSQPLRSRANAERLAERGVNFVDAPVSGGVRGVVAGTLAIMAGGPESLVAEATPVLEVLGRVTRVGDIGAGHAAKALNNLVSAAHLWMTSEAVLVGREFGIEPETLVDVINASTGRSVSSEVKWPKFILPGTFDSGFGAALLAKDTRVAVDLRQSLGLPGLLDDTVATLWERAVAELPAGADHTEVARYIDEAHGRGPA
ncbi:NAD(P)-dependent oxidoreductase [Microbacterium sp. NPDC091313]